MRQFLRLADFDSGFRGPSKGEQRTRKYSLSRNLHLRLFSSVRLIANLAGRRCRIRRVPIFNRDNTKGKAAVLSSCLLAHLGAYREGFFLSLAGFCEFSLSQKKSALNEARISQAPLISRLLIKIRLLLHTLLCGSEVSLGKQDLGKIVERDRRAYFVSNAAPNRKTFFLHLARPGEFAQVLQNDPQICERANGAALFSNFTADAESLLIHFARRRQLVLLIKQDPDIVQTNSLATAVTDLPTEGERLLIGLLRGCEVCFVLADDSNAVQRVAHASAVSDGPADVQRLLMHLKRCCIVALFGNRRGDVVQGGRLSAAIAGFHKQAFRSLGCVLRLLRIPEAEECATLREFRPSHQQSRALRPAFLLRLPGHCQLALVIRQAVRRLRFGEIDPRVVGSRGRHFAQCIDGSERFLCLGTARLCCRKTQTIVEVVRSKVP